MLNIKKNENGDEDKYQNDVQSKIMWGTLKNLTNTNKQVPQGLYYIMEI